MKKIVLAVFAGILAGSGFSGIYTNFDAFQAYQSDAFLYQGIMILHWVALFGAALLAKSFLLLEKTEHIIPVLVMALTFYVTLGIRIFA